MSKDLMLSKMVEWLLFNEDADGRERMLFLKENDVWHNKPRMRQVQWYNAKRLVTAFNCLYVCEDNYFIPIEDRRDYANRVRKWEIMEIPPKSMLRKTYELRYAQRGYE